MNVRPNEAGVILIVTLIIMAILLSTAIGFGIFILSDLRQAAQIDNSVAAYHAAEAGLERSLFVLRYFEDVSTAADLKARPNVASASWPRGGWDMAASVDYEAVFYRQRLASGQAARLYVTGRASGANESEYLGVIWKKGEIGTKMQVTFTQLNPQEYLDADSINQVIFYTDKSLVVSDAAAGFCQKLSDAAVENCQSGCSGKKDYAVDIRALGTSQNDYLTEVTARTYSDADCTAPVIDGITNITLKSTGIYSGSRQQIVAQVPPRDPISGVLGFVLFSETDITKGD